MLERRKLLNRKDATNWSLDKETVHYCYFRIFAILFKINIILEVREKTVFSSPLLHFQSVSFPVYLFRNKAHGTNTPFCISNRCRPCDPFSPLNHRRHWHSFWRTMFARVNLIRDYFVALSSGSTAFVSRIDRKIVCRKGHLSNHSHHFFTMNTKGCWVTSRERVNPSRPPWHMMALTQTCVAFRWVQRSLPFFGPFVGQFLINFGWSKFGFC